MATYKSDVFHNVAVRVETLVNHKKLDENVAQSIIESLINGLLRLGWDTADESMAEYVDVPFIYQAFEQCDVKVEY